MTVLARELACAVEPVIRNNILVIMADLAVRYTNLVDRYIPYMSCCLSDSHPVVRRHALLVLTQLLQVTPPLSPLLLLRAPIPSVTQHAPPLSSLSLACRLPPEGSGNRSHALSTVAICSFAPLPLCSFVVALFRRTT
jgi:hypothetical protein